MSYMDNMSWSIIDEAAAHLGVSTDARRKWRERGRVPHRWRIPIIQEARRAGHQLALDDTAFDTVAAEETVA